MNEFGNIYKTEEFPKISILRMLKKQLLETSSRCATLQCI